MLGWEGRIHDLEQKILREAVNQKRDPVACLSNQLCTKGH